MKRLVTYCLSLYLSLFVMIAGSGVSLVHYCCKDCARQGIGHIVNGTCEQLHHKNHKHNALCHHSDHCRLIHYTIAKMLLDGQNDMQQAPQVLQMLPTLTSGVFYIIHNSATCLPTDSNAPPLVLHTGRTILQQIRILLL